MGIELYRFYARTVANILYLNMNMGIATGVDLGRIDYEIAIAESC